MSNYDIEKIVTHIMKQNGIRNKKIKKYYQLKWFLKALQSNRYTFQKPSTWDDPFEDFISELIPKNTFIQDEHPTNDIYAMSTIRKTNECAGMWSNFANNSGVIVDIYPKKLLTSMVKFILEKNCFIKNRYHDDINSLHKLFAENIKIKHIDYMKDEEIAQLFKKDDIDKFKSLSFKRKEYKYEKESRIFLIPKLLHLDEEKYLEDTYLNICYFRETIDKITLSPTASETRIKRLENILTKRYKIDTNIIEKSELYDIERFKEKFQI